jgi:hypothetical protein
LERAEKIKQQLNHSGTPGETKIAIDPEFFFFFPDGIGPSR